MGLQLQCFPLQRERREKRKCCENMHKNNASWISTNMSETQCKNRILESEVRKFPRFRLSPGVTQAARGSGCWYRPAAPVSISTGRSVGRVERLALYTPRLWRRTWNKQESCPTARFEGFEKKSDDLMNLTSTKELFGFQAIPLPNSRGSPLGVPCAKTRHGGLKVDLTDLQRVKGTEIPVSTLPPQREA